jgi:hypothetical protein
VHVKSDPFHSVIPPRALYSHAPEYVGSMRGVLLRGALGECGNPSSDLSFPRMRESSLVLVVCPLFCRCQRRQGNEVLLVGGFTDKNDG